MSFWVPSSDTSGFFPDARELEHDGPFRDSALLCAREAKFPANCVQAESVRMEQLGEWPRRRALDKVQARRRKQLGLSFAPGNTSS
jgi:hypothetical protein